MGRSLTKAREEARRLYLTGEMTTNAEIAARLRVKPHTVGAWDLARAITGAVPGAPSSHRPVPASVDSGASDAMPLPRRTRDSAQPEGVSHALDPCANLMRDSELRLLQAVLQSAQKRVGPAISRVTLK